MSSHIPLPILLDESLRASDQADLLHWQERAKHLTEDEQANIDHILYVLRCHCLRLNGSRLDFRITANTVLADAIYGFVDKDGKPRHE